MSFFNPHPARRRFLVALPLGILAGLICVAFASQTNPEIWDVKNMLFWTLISDRFLIGLVVGLAGAFTHHPVFGFRCHPLLRGAVMGTFVSLPIAFGGIINPATLPVGVTPVFVFFATIGAGAVYGSIIDLIATKFGGEGKALI